jgi:hypothetical protein
VTKRDMAMSKLAEVTQKIRSLLDDLEQRRPSMLVTEMSALIGIMQASTARQSAELALMLPSVPHAAVTICALAHGIDHGGGVMGNAEMREGSFEDAPLDGAD